jgi:hypothetical protein
MIRGLNPAAGTEREKMETKLLIGLFWVKISGQVKF